ncbi:hypothetical protein [Segatella bryantii]|uniref:hypothetical protein n=1 Tax=Segatella bryantii TaxID=77095 RepID=UPI00115FE266|nr:hypothetical protein [Segatella bryantii]
MYGYCRNGACLELQTNGKWKEVTPLHDAIRPQMFHLWSATKWYGNFHTTKRRARVCDKVKTLYIFR